MARAAWLKILIITAMSVVLAGAPSALAQRGGGFHGSGFGGMHSPGFGGFHGQGFHGQGFHGGGFGGFHPGFGGFHGGFGGPRFSGRGSPWGFPGWGWGFNIGFGFGPYWGGYPYFWGSGPWWGPYGYYPPYAYYPPYNAYDAPDDRDDPNRDYREGYDDYRYDPEFRRPPANAPKPNDSDDNGGQKPTSSQEAPARAENQLALNFAVYRPAVSDERIDQTVRAALYSPLRNPQDGSTLPPAVRNVIEALRAMPPAARLRQLSSGRYSGFSPEERELLRDQLLRDQAPVFKAE